jgi:hypothetical protein
MKRIAGAIAGAGLLLATFASPAHAASTAINTTEGLHPYAIVSANATYGTFAVGSTNPGQPDGELCLKVVIASNASLWLSNTDSGNVMNNAGSVLYQNLDQTLAPIGGTCTLNTTNVTTTGKTVTSAGQVQFNGIKTKSGIDRGIASGSSTTYTVTKPSASTVTAPQCPVGGPFIACYDTSKLNVNIQNGGPGSTTAVVTVSALAPAVTPTPVAAIISKSKLDLGACELEEHDVTPTAGAYSGSGTWTGTYQICAQTAGQNLITSAAFTLNVTGMAAAESATLTAIQTVTSSVRLWDQTLVNTDTNFGPVGTCKIADQTSRAISCKGWWGAVVPLNIAVRKGSPVTGGAPYGNPAGINDPDGITTPLPVVLGTGIAL